MGIQHVIDALRLMVHDLSTPYVFSDTEMTTLLNMNMDIIDREELESNADGTLWESTLTSFATPIVLYDGNSESSAVVTPSTPATINYMQGYFEFTTNPDVTVYLSGKSYDIYGAAELCLGALMTDPNKANSWSRGGVNYNHYNLVLLKHEFHNMRRPRYTQIVKTYFG